MRKSLTNKVFIIYTSIIVLVIVSIGGYLCLQLGQKAEKSFEQTAEKDLNSAAKHLQETLSNMNLTLNILNSGNTQIQSFLENYTGDLIQDVRTYERFKNEFRGYMNVSLHYKLANYRAFFFVDQSMPLSVIFSDSDKKMFEYNNYSLKSILFYNDDALREEEWYKNTVQNAGREYWFQHPDRPNLVSMSRQLVYFVNEHNSAKKKITGIVLIQFDVSEFLGSENSDKMKNGYVSYLVENTGNIIYSSDKDSKYTKWVKQMYTEGNMSYESMRKQRIYGDDMYVTCYRVNDKLDMVVLNSATTIRRLVYDSVALIIAIVMIVVIITVILFWIITKKLINPIRILSEHMVEKDLLKPISYNGTNQDEVYVLYESFNSLIVRIKGLIHFKEKAAIEKASAEYEILQAQINPHFVYNTLDSVCCMALIDGKDEIAQTLSSLANILRYNISGKEKLTTIFDEINTLEEYMYIQKNRWQDRIEYSFDIEDRYNSCYIPKVTLQPLIENSLQYGMNSGEHKLTIQVSCAAQNDKLMIYIDDSGKMADIEAINNYLKGDTQLTRKGTGLGIHNVDQRIKMLFGEDYGLHYSKSPQNGTRVIIRIPYIDKKGNVGN